MKLNKLGLMAMAAMMLMGCGKLPEGKDIKDLKNATTADSISILMGQGASLKYWQMAQHDTLLATQAGKDAYIKGYLKGMELINSDDQAYNAGLKDGMEAAMNLAAVNKDYQLKTSKNLYLQGLAFGLKSDSAVNAQQLQAALMPLGQRLGQQKEERDKKEAQQMLESIVKKEKLTRNGDFAYKMVRPGQGADLTNGTMVLVDLSVKDMNGKDMIPSAGKPQPIEVGARNFPQAINTMFTKMKPGSEAVLYAPAMTLGLSNKPTDMVKVTLKVAGYCNEKGESVNEPVIGPQAKAMAEQADKLGAQAKKPVNAEAIPADGKAAKVATKPANAK